MNDEEFFQQLLETFKVEAEEYLTAIAGELLTLEQQSDVLVQIQILESIYRQAHSLKGAARAVNLTAVETFCHSLENIFSALKTRQLSVTAELMDILHEATRTLNDFLHLPQHEQAGQARLKLQTMIRRLDKIVDNRQLISYSQAISSEPLNSSSPDELFQQYQQIYQNNQQDEDQPGEDLLKESQPIEHLAMEHDEPLPSPLLPEMEAPTDLTPLIPASVIDTNRLSDMDEQPVLETNLTAEGELIVRERTGSREQTVRIASSKLDSILLQAEELLTLKLSTTERAREIQSLNEFLSSWHREWIKLQPEISRAQHVLKNPATVWSENFVLFSKVLTFLDWNYTHIRSLETRMGSLARAAQQDRLSVGSMLDNLLNDSKQALLSPFSLILNSLPNLVRELARSTGKEIDFSIEGEALEIDRRILQEIKDPLIHLLRNSVDHGIESPAQRRQLNKPARGAITLKILQKDGNNIILTSTDDGAGIDLAKLKSTAIKMRLISVEEAQRLTNAEALNLIFQSGMSTAATITDVSGRGLGLAIVREKIERLGGSITVSSIAGKGTKFSILLPISFATFRGTLVQVNDQIFIIPTINITRVTRVKQTEIRSIENRATVEIGNQIIGFAYLADILEMPRRQDETRDYLTLVLVNVLDQTLAFCVDQIVNEQEVLIKRLGGQLSRVRNIAGATVLGNGKAVAVLNPSDLIRSAIMHSTTAVEPINAPIDTRQQSILVVEDSITSRTLVKNILESAGYQVTVAVDGVDALTQLKTNDFDLVISDVDMPRMNGFELTAKMRADKRLAELPVILVTSLARREDREYGINVGANAYIVKSNFDQGNLLEAISRLI